jgi:hypothetical protein
MTPALFALVAAGCAVLAYLSRGEDRLSLAVAALGWAGIAVLAYHS